MTASDAVERVASDGRPQRPAADASQHRPEADRAVADGIVNLLVVICDNKWFLGHHLSQWAVGAPGLESAVAVAAIAQGHLGQSRVLLPFVDRLVDGDDRIGTPDEGRERRYNVAALDAPFQSWAQAVATLYLVDPALNVVLRTLQDTQEELARRTGRVLTESRFYSDFARGRLADLTRNWEHGRSHLRPHLSVLTEMLCWFGPEGEPGVEALRGAGVLRGGNDDMRRAYLDEVAPPLLDLGYDLPGVTGGRGEWHIDELPWPRWQRLQRRLDPPAP